MLQQKKKIYEVESIIKLWNINFEHKTIMCMINDRNFLTLFSFFPWSFLNKQTKKQTIF